MRNRPHYVAMIRRMVRETADLRRPGVHHVEVRHDDDCRHWDGGTCDCEPAVVSGKRVQDKYASGEGDR